MCSRGWRVVFCIPRKNTRMTFALMYPAILALYLYFINKMNISPARFF
jgi:hypothetical protein